MKRVIFLPLLLLFAGCGVTAARQPVAATPAATHTVSVPKPKPFVADRVIAARSGHISDFDVRLEITHLERTGATTSLSLRLTSEDPDFAPFIGDGLDDGETQPIRGSDSRENGYSVDGVYLLDRGHAQKYLVARDPDGRCICDVGIGETRVSSEPITMSATYGAPPPEVHAVDVVVPNFGTFANVPLG
jgi:hypothetical protein